MIHCGELITLEMKRQQVVKKDICDYVGILPQNLGRTLERESMDSNLLEKFCEYLKLDPMTFFEYRPNLDSNQMVGSIDQAVFLGSANVHFSKNEMSLMNKLLSEKERIIVMQANQIAVLQKLVDMFSRSGGIQGHMVDNQE